MFVPRHTAEKYFHRYSEFRYCLVVKSSSGIGSNDNEVASLAGWGVFGLSGAVI